MTEDEAKTKWCPQARTAVADKRQQVQGHNRVAVDHGSRTEQVDSPLYSRCIGSACMAWRWEIGPKKAEALNHLSQGPGGSGELYESDGFCGLAGARP